MVIGISSASADASLAKEHEVISVEQLLSLGLEYHNNNQILQAEVLYRAVLGTHPSNAYASYWLGLIEESRKHYQEAANLFSNAVKHRPKFPEAWHHLGTIAVLANQPERALGYYERAIREQPDFVPAYNNIASLLIRCREWDKAAEYLRKALQYNPNSGEAQNNFAMVLNHWGRAEEALAAYQKALDLLKNVNEIGTNIGSVYRTIGELEQAEHWFRRALQEQPDHPKATVTFSNLLMLMPYQLRYSTAEVKATARGWHERYGTRYTPFSYSARTPRQRLKIGYISADFFHHPVGYFLQAPFKYHDPKAVEIFCYSNLAFTDEITEELKANSEHWRQVEGLSDEQLCERIRADGIDILIDLSGHTAKNRLGVFARKPAPVQASWIGFFATTGLPTMDYIIADLHTLPPAEEGDYVEKPARLPDYYLCFTPPNRDIPVAALPALATQSIPHAFEEVVGVGAVRRAEPTVVGEHDESRTTTPQFFKRERYITFGCFNALTKITPETIRLWSAVLNRLPNASLLLKNKQLADTATCDRLVAKFAAHGIAAERLRFEGQSPFYDMFSAYNQVDIALDPYPFAGNTVTLQGLWMGVPVVTLASPRFVGHMGEGIMQVLGLPEWVARSEAEYVEKAVALAGDITALAELRQRLRPMLLESKLCDGARFAQELEKLYQRMWEAL